MEWWAIGLIWLACAVGCLLLGERQGKPGKALAFGLLFGPAALAVVVGEAGRLPRPSLPRGWFTWACLTAGQVVTALASAGCLVVGGWAVLHLAGATGPVVAAPAFGVPPPWIEGYPWVTALAAALGFLYHAGLWMVFSWVKRSMLASMAEPNNTTDRGRSG